jgi:long-chain acyl-CoA synthetase
MSRFWARAQQDPGRVALVDPAGESVTAGALLRAGNQAVHAARAAGVHAGDTVAALLPNCTELFELYLAAMQAGWYLTPINHHLTAAEVAHIVEDCGAKLLVTHERFVDIATEATTALPRPLTVLTVGATALGQEWRATLRAHPDHLPADRRSGGIMYYTSGTTGRPKGVRRPLPACGPDESAGMYSELLSLCGITSSAADVHLCTSPLYHTAVLAFATDALHGGQTVVVMDRWDAAGALDRIARHGVTNTHVVPTQFHRLLALPEPVRAGADVSTLRYVLHGAAPCPVAVKRRMIEWWGPVIVEYYGTTEGGGTVVTSGEWLARPGTVGRPWPGAAIRILDEGGEPVPTGEPGLVYIKLGSEPFEYFGDPAKTAGGRLGDFFTVGDIGYLDTAGYLFLCDRVADVIIAGGVNIYPAEIESVLLALPAVADVAVVGALDGALGERVVAVVEPRAARAGDGSLAAELIEHCAGRLARFKTPTEVRLVDSLPRDPNGKLPRRVVREAVREADLPHSTEGRT